jgi:hypothetical protein
MPAIVDPATNTAVRVGPRKIANTTRTLPVRDSSDRSERCSVLAFDPAELRSAGVEVGKLPDENGHLIDAESLPGDFAEKLQREGLDTSKPIRVVGTIARGTDGRPGHYSIHFQQP